LRAIRGDSTRRGSRIDSATHRLSGRSWAKLWLRFRKIPTDTGSTCTGPMVSRWAITASKTGRSQGGPVAKYSSIDMAGAHSWDCPRRRKRRPQSGHVHPGTAIA
jgi:hypothetical protein